MAHSLALPERAKYWRERATVIHAKIIQRAWSHERQAFVESFEGTDLDASVLLMGEVGIPERQGSALHQHRGSHGENALRRTLHAALRSSR